MSDEPFRILIVDDDPGSLYAKSRILRRAGYDVSEAASGGEALEKLHSLRPHLVALDVRLPDMSGLEVCARIKRDPQIATLVLQTSATFIEASDRVAGLDHGADMYLVEPIAGEELLAVVRALLRLHCAEAELKTLLTREREARARADEAADALRCGNARLEQEIAERAEMEAALREADRRKDEFLAMLAHELRNPLAPIRNAVQLLHMQAEVPLACGIIERQVKHLGRLVDDLLDVSRITRGQIRLERVPIDLQSVIASAIEAARPLIEQRGHRLEVSMPQQPLRVLGDLTRLSQVVLNLLNNAAKYMEAGGRIALTLERENDEGVIRVRDEGLGIAPELLPRVFELFTQADRTLERSEGGLGVGLTLVRGLTTLHAGRVEAVSAGPGHGSEFVVHLPLLPPTYPADAQPRGEAAPADRETPKLRVLVVDDNRDAADSLQMLLNSAGHHACATYDGPSALRRVAEFSPQVVLLDIGLPGMSGIEVARKLHEGRDADGPVLIAMSGYGQDADRQRSAEAGFTAHLVKPIDLERLGALLEQHTAHARAAPASSGRGPTAVTG